MDAAHELSLNRAEAEGHKFAAILLVSDLVATNRGAFNAIVDRASEAFAAISPEATTDDQASDLEAAFFCGAEALFKAFPRGRAGR